MATTLVNFVRLTSAALVGSTVRAAGKVVGYKPNNATTVVSGSVATALDKVTIDFSTDSNAKHGAATVALSGTTPKTIDLTDLTSVTDSYDGDTTFATVYVLVLKNLGAGSLTVATGASNGMSLPLNGTSPTLTIASGNTDVFIFSAGLTIDNTHKTMLITPAADTTFSIAISGA